MSSEHLHDLHARDIGLSVAEIDHVRERDALVVLGLAFVDLLVVSDTENAFVDLEEELGLGSVVNRYSRPLGLSVFIIYERACEYPFELFRYVGSLDHFCQSGRIDVMFYLHSPLLSVCIHETEPFADSVEEFDRCSEPFEVVASKLDSGLAGFVEHKFHIAEDIAGILSHCNIVTFLPELLRLLSDGLDESEFLHVARRQCAVKIIDKCYDRTLFHKILLLRVKNSPP